MKKQIDFRNLFAIELAKQSKESIEAKPEEHSSEYTEAIVEPAKKKVGRPKKVKFIPRDAIEQREKKIGRPQIRWSDQQWNAFEAICRVTNKPYAIETVMGVRSTTIDSILKRERGVSFEDYLAKSWENTKYQLRAKQIDMALAGHPTMLIWLGKQILDQSDKTQLDANVSLSWADLVSAAQGNAQLTDGEGGDDDEE